MKGHSRPTAYSRREVVRNWGKYGHLVLTKRVERQRPSTNSVSRLIDRIDMTLILLKSSKSKKQKQFEDLDYAVLNM